ncbi:MAG: Holliday junction resolvase RuvX [Patescibacteria group bacterium]
MKILALDWGEQRTGLAIGYTESKLALPFGVIAEAETLELIKKIIKIIKEEEIELLLVGEPKTMSGGDSKQTKKVQEFVQNLKQELTIKVELMDERLTTKRASGPSSLPTRSNDELAAMYLLQDYLDRYNLA